MNKRQRSRSRSPGRRRKDRSRSPRRHKSRSPSPASRFHGKKNRTCVEYAKGNCFRGSECRFLHDELDEKVPRRSYSSKRDYYRRDWNRKSKSRELEDQDENSRRMGSSSPKDYSRRVESSSPRDHPRRMESSSPRDRLRRMESSSPWEYPRRLESPGSREFSRSGNSPPRPEAELVKDQHRVVDDHNGNMEKQFKLQEYKKSPPAIWNSEDHDAASNGGLTSDIANIADEKHSTPMPEMTGALEAAEAPTAFVASDLSPQLAKTDSAGLQTKADRESRSLKVLRNAVTDFVKESLKPAWKEGQLSKVAFKTIAQKAVEKVMGTLEGHEIPKGQAKIEQFMDSSHAKITKLVKGYLDKYVS